MYKQDLVRNNLQCLICHKTKQNKTNQMTDSRVMFGWGSPTSQYGGPDSVL